MMKNVFLANSDVAQFIDWMGKVIDGKISITHTYIIRDRRLPTDYLHQREFKIHSLENAFERYFWDGKDYDKNASILEEIALFVQKAEAQSDLQTTLLAVDKVLEWGAGGTGQKLYTANMDWAKQCGDELVERLHRGVAALNTDDLSTLGVFGASNGPRMNAGFTKYFSLACRQSIIYDGRVGAALGYLVRCYCRQNEKYLPDLLAFRWGAQSGKNPLNRDPSEPPFFFKQLPVRGRIWAEWNQRANWVLGASIKSSNASWVKSPDGLRRLEAALFMIGYEMPNLNRAL